jgi:hypothetical protein
MTSQPPLALVRRNEHLYISGILPAARPEMSTLEGLIRVRFIGQGRPHQAYLEGLSYGPVGEGETHELAAQALVEKLQADTLDFPAFLLTLATGAENEANNDGLNLDDIDTEALEQQAALLRIIAGLAAQTRPAPAIGPDDFTEDDDAIEFYADGEYGTTTVERLTLRIEPRAFDEDDEDAEDLLDFTLRADGELHDGHSTLAGIARSYPNVAPTLEAWKAGHTVPFAVMLTAARMLAGLTEPLPEEPAPQR